MITYFEVGDKVIHLVDRGFPENSGKSRKSYEEAPDMYRAHEGVIVGITKNGTLQVKLSNTIVKACLTNTVRKI